MKISKVTEERIYFDNGDCITYDHDQECCERNYADFTVINENTVGYDYDFKELHFKMIDGIGFLFGEPEHWLFVPCYSVQNGYYTDNIEIYYNGKEVLSFDCEEAYG